MIISVTACRRPSLQDARVYRGADLPSDHHLVFAKLKLELNRYTTNCKAKEFNTRLFQDMIHSTFKIKLANKFIALAQVNEEYHNIRVEDTWT